MTTDGAERADTACPSCDEPVGARASFCMHCGRDLPDRTEYDEVTGQAETGDGGETLLSRLRPGTSTEQAGESVGAADTPAVVESRTGTVDDGSIETERTATDADGIGTADEGSVGFGPTADSSAATSRIPVPSGRGTDGPTLLPTDGLFEDAETAGKMLGILGLFAISAVYGLGLPLPVTGAVLAVLSWVVSVVAIADRRSGFDAMRYGSYSLMVLLICVSFGFAFSAAGSGLLSFALTLIPVAVATLFVAGFGYTLGDSPA